jgi:hypothetical protein
VDSLQHAKDHLFERRSVVHDHELLTEALRYGRGRVDVGQLRGALEIEKSQGTVIHAGGRVATHESLDREQRMAAIVNRGIDNYGRLSGTHEFQPAERLREEQKRAIQQILGSRDFAINLRGAAGTGKTATL